MMPGTPTTDTTFLETVRLWIAQRGEVLVMMCFHAMGGSKSFGFCRSSGEFDALLAKLAERTITIVFRERHLPLRGRVDDDFRLAARAHLEPGRDWLLVDLSSYQDELGDSLAELEEGLAKFDGREAAFGTYPEWLDDRDGVISATVPDASGRVLPGAY
jgi:hypothetical protein